MVEIDSFRYLAARDREKNGSTTVVTSLARRVDYIQESARK